MDYYLKRKDNYEDRIQREDIPIPILPNIFRWIPVKEGTNVPLVTDTVAEELISKKESCIVWCGAGESISKTIACAEIVKCKLPQLLQITRINYKIVAERWEPGIVYPQTPFIYIMQTMDKNDPVTLGYKLSKSCFWVEYPEEPSTNTKGSSSKTELSNQLQNSPKKK